MENWSSYDKLHVYTVVLTWALGIFWSSWLLLLVADKVN